MVDKAEVPETGPNSIAVARTPGTTILAVLFHMGMLAIVFSSVLTIQPPTYQTAYFGLTAALGAAAIVVLCVYRSRFAATSAGRAVTALMAGICYSKAYDPQLTALLPSWNERLPIFVTDIAPGLGMVGLVLALLSTALYLVASADRRPVHVPFGWTTVAAGMLIAVLGVIMYVTLAPIYELQGGLYTILLMSRAAEYTLLLLAVQRMSGASGVGAVTTWYIALALVAAAVRNMAAGPM